MEIRQALALERHPKRGDAQIALLGTWARPHRPHLHDPITLSADYFETCYITIDQAVRNLAREVRQSRAGSAVA
jgi:protein-tyrosine phosphatase